MTGGLELDVAREFHSAVGAAVGNSFTPVVTAGIVDVLDAGEGFQALQANTFHLVSGTLGGRFGLVHAGKDLGEDAAQDVLAFGVWCVGGSGDGGD